MDVVELAKKRAQARTYLFHLGQENVYGRTIEQEVAAAARYKLAQDAYMRADAEYHAAMSALTPDASRACSISESLAVVIMSRVRPLRCCSRLVMLTT